MEQAEYQDTVFISLPYGWSHIARLFPLYGEKT
jgi:hypothetical protein